MRLLSLLMLFALPAHLPAQAETIKLSGPPIWESAPLIAMAETQPLADQGITFTFERWSSPEELRQGLMQDAPLLAVAPSLTTALYGARGIPFVPQSATATGGSLWLIGKGDPITGPEELVGLRLALPFKGFLPDLLMQRITHDVPDSYTPEYTPDYMAAMQFMLVGKADLVLLPEPLASALLHQSTDLTRRADVCDLWKSTTGLEHCAPAGMLIATAAADRADLRAAYNASFDDLAANPGEAAALLAQAFPFLPLVHPAVYANIDAERVDLSSDTATVMDFFQEIFDIAPEALGGELPDPDLFTIGAD